MLQNMYRIISRIDLMESLSELPLGLKSVQDAIRDAASDIEKTEAGDAAAAYAREIVQVLTDLCTSDLPPTQKVGTSPLGERIARLGRYVETLADGPAGAGDLPACGNATSH